MKSFEVTSTRDIAREAIRAQLAQVAHDLFLRVGYDKVTINDLATAAGVSRSTFLRYFSSKEEAVVGAIDLQNALLADALRARPIDEDDWTALRRALDVTMVPYRQDPDRALTLTRLIQDTPALSARRVEKHNNWQPAMAEALAERRTSAGSPTVSDWVRAGAALACLNVALRYWSDSDGNLGLVDVLDEAFAALAPPPEPAPRPRRRS